ncbi:hypothetical protein D3C78_1418900 [compost metagenome]
MAGGTQRVIQSAQALPEVAAGLGQAQRLRGQRPGPVEMFGHVRRNHGRARPGAQIFQRAAQQLLGNQQGLGLPNLGGQALLAVPEGGALANQDQGGRRRGVQFSGHRAGS